MVQSIQRGKKHEKLKDNARLVDSGGYSTYTFYIPGK